MKNQVIIAALILFSAGTLHAQTGGNNTFEFLNLPSSARIAAMGGNVISIKDNDLNLAFQNPAVLNQALNKQIVLSYVPYFADIKYGYAAYAQHYSIGTFSAAMHYVDYGEFIKADNTGFQNGTFGAKEYSFNIAYAREVYKNVSAGATLKTIYSSLEEFTSTGIAADLGIIYTSENTQLGVAAVIKNIGRQISTYTPGNNEPLPFEVQLAMTYRLAKSPLRFTLNAVHLEKMNLTYTNTELENETDPVTGDTLKQKISLFEKIARHGVLGIEILITQNFNLRIGYNYMRRKDLGLESRMSISGFSGGFGFRISKFHLSYGRAAYHLAGASNHFSIAANLGEFFRKTNSPAVK